MDFGFLLPNFQLAFLEPAPFLNSEESSATALHGLCLKAEQKKKKQALQRSAKRIKFSSVYFFSFKNKRNANKLENDLKTTCEK